MEKETYIFKTVRPQDRKTVRPQDCETVRPQDRKTIRPQDCETVRPQDRKTVRPQDCETVRPQDRKTVRCFLLACSLVFLFSTAYGQYKMNREEYIALYKDVAISKMREYKIPASITLAQGILESGCGGSVLAVEANNHFGIKCHKEWTGKRFYYDDDEKDECFRVYDHAEGSYHDHSLFLTTRDRYNQLFTLKITDYEAWAHGLKSAGYATNPQYAHLLIKIIEEQQLYLYDKMALDKTYAVVLQPDNTSTSTSTATPYIPKTILPEPRKIKTAPDGRAVYENNGIQLVYAGKNDNYRRIAKDIGTSASKLSKFNEKSKKQPLKAGEMVYLEKKKKKGVVTHYFVQPEETLLDIAQKTGMTTKALISKNRITATTVPEAGSMLWLEKKKP
ncbi:MAG: glucosaminidase domain-containing protein [Bacteroidales bacterium]|nr:glucosaminidase domain-containing protein [Bacteroidales bacterium]